MEAPSVTAVFASTWARVPAIFRSRPRFYWAWIVGGAIVGALALLTPAKAFATQSGPQVTPALVTSLIGYWLMAIVLVYFILADAVRTIVPAFRMTPEVFAIMFVLNLIFSAALQFATYAFIVPAFYVGPKLWLATPYYLLRSFEPTDIVSNLTRAWRDTDNVYWPTFGFWTLEFVVVGLIQFGGLGIAAISIQYVPVSAIVMLPFALATSMFAFGAFYLGWLNWAVVIRRRADALLTAAVQ
jgi:hypothetical protein